MSISAVILTHNEEKNIERCIATLAWSNEIIIIDDYSQDCTIESVKRKAESVKNEIKIYKRKLNGDFAEQRNLGLEKASGDWILFVDADEVISETLVSEIKSEIRNPKSEIRGFYFKRKDYFGGKWLKYGEIANVRLLRLGRKGKGIWEGRVHEVWKIEGKTQELKNPILHYPHPTVFEFLKEVNCYTDIVVQCWKEEGRKIKIWEIIVFPAGKFIRNYIIRLGFLDGVAGLIMAIFMSFHSFLARSKYWISSHKL